MSHETCDLAMLIIDDRASLLWPDVEADQTYHGSVNAGAGRRDDPHSGIFIMIHHRQAIRSLATSQRPVCLRRSLRSAYTVKKNQWLLLVASGLRHALEGQGLRMSSARHRCRNNYQLPVNSTSPAYPWAMAVALPLAESARAPLKSRRQGS